MQTLTISDIVSATCGAVICGDTAGEIHTITTDSRKADKGVLFIPLKGEHQDGHDYIQSALKSGAVSISERDIDGCGTVIKVENTRIALGDIARYYKQKYPVRSVSITGSVGKTTTKDLVYSVIAQKYKTHKTPNNFNNDIGVPLTIFGIEAEHQAAVIEMGMNHFGEISYLSDIARPDSAIITNIGMSHIENLGSQDGIFKAKMEIIERFTDANTLIVNGDDEYLKTICDVPYKLVRFGMSVENDVYAKDIVNRGLQGMDFTVVHRGGEFRCTLTQPGEHNIYNALAAVCAGLDMGVSEIDIANGIQNCEYTASRLEISEHNGIEIINDCYNSSPASVRAALKVMSYTVKSRRVAVLGDILEMGEYAKDAHLDLGRTVAELGVDLLITAGDNAKYIADGAKSEGMTDVISYPTTVALANDINNLVKPDDCVLIKASHGMEFYRIAETISAEEEAK